MDELENQSLTKSGWTRALNRTSFTPPSRSLLDTSNRYFIRLSIVMIRRVLCSHVTEYLGT
jgi:hypothetical protein